MLFVFASILLLSNSIVAQEHSITLVNKMNSDVKEIGHKGSVFCVVLGYLADVGKPISVIEKVPARRASPLHTHRSSYWKVIIEGNQRAFTGDLKNAKPIPPGSTWFELGKTYIATSALKERTAYFLFNTTKVWICSC